MIVSVVIPAVQPNGLLLRTVESIRSQHLPDDVELEIVIALRGLEVPTIDGCRTVSNPSGTIPDGLNAALDASRGEIVLRCDSRCDLPDGYVSRCIDALADPRVGMVGGLPLVTDPGILLGAYGIAFNSPLLGPSRHRYGRRSGPSDTAYLGAWRRVDLEKLGGWDSRLIRNQDNELAARVRYSGAIVLFDADLVVGYFTARSLAGLIRHHHGFGRWRMVQRSLDQESLTTRHRGALIVAGVAATTALVATKLLPSKATATVVAAVYGTGVFVGWSTSRRVRGARPDLDVHPGAVSHLIAPAVAATVNAAWLGGVIRELLLARRDQERPSATAPNSSDQAERTAGQAEASATRKAAEAND